MQWLVIFDNPHHVTKVQVTATSRASAIDKARGFVGAAPGRLLAAAPLRGPRAPQTPEPETATVTRLRAARVSSIEPQKGDGT